MVIRTSELATWHHNKHNKGNEGGSQNPQGIIRGSATSRTWARPAHGQMGSLESNEDLCVRIEIHAQNQKQPEKKKFSRPLTTEESSKQIQFWMKKVQSRSEETVQGGPAEAEFAAKWLGVYQCRGRIQRDYPTYLLEDEAFTEKLVLNAHMLTHHGGVGLTMAKTREQYWVPRVKRLDKRLIKRCHDCNRFQATAFANPPTGHLRKVRTEGATPFRVVSMDHAGPIKYQTKTKIEAKAYIILYAYSLTRGLYL